VDTAERLTNGGPLFMAVHFDSSVSILDTLVQKQIRELQADDIERSG
jgi:hypothetical protein